MSGKRKRERLGLPRRYTFKLYPTAEQEQELLRQCRMSTELWNALLDMVDTIYRRHRGRDANRGVVHADGKASLTFFDMTAAITSLRHECPEWADLSVWTAHRVADALTKAMQAFMRRAKEGAGAASGYPKFRATRHANWLPHRFKSGCKLVPIEGTKRDWHLTLKGVPGPIFCKGRFPASPLDWNDADIRYRDGTWWLSVGVEQSPGLVAGTEPIEVRFDLIDCFAGVNGRPVHIWEVWPKYDALIDQDIAELQRRMKDAEAAARRKDGSWEDYHALRRRKARLEARIARQKREALHEWTTAIVRRASELTVIKPAAAIKDATRSGKGSEKDWGANVALKAEFNRHVLDQAPAMTMSMLAYKAAEAGIPYREEAASDQLMAGNHAVRNAKAIRRTRRAIKAEERLSA